jgi:hypothetical protein
LKLIIRQYLAALKERGELDAILPDLLSGLGFNVYSRPTRGTTQHGVDVAAIGRDEDGKKKVYLFSVKQGDLTRQDWDGTPQGLRSSLNEIRDVYIPSKIPKRFKQLKVVICLCFGGDVQEQVRAHVSGYTRSNTTRKISFDEWNGDKLAELLLSGILREELLPKLYRSSFQKAVAFVDEPDVAYRHFAELVRQLHASVNAGKGKRATVARQLYICLWILFVWARESDNVDAPYRASELVILFVWDLLRPLIGKRSTDAAAVNTVFHQVIQLHLLVASELLDRKIIPHVGKKNVLSFAVHASSAIDINLKLFDILGRVAMTGLWIHWLVGLRQEPIDPETQRKISEWVENGFKLIKNNPALFLPVCDQQAIEIGLFLLLVTISEPLSQHDVSRWLHHMVSRLAFTIRAHGQYPCIFTDYRELVDHPREQTESYRAEATAGSILIPLVAAWLAALQDEDGLATLIKLMNDELKHCTLQLWLPDKDSEDKLYTGARDHGIVLADLPLTPSGRDLLETIAKTCSTQTSFNDLSAWKTGIWPIILVACRHHRLPIPPHFWIDSLYSASGDGASEKTS